MDIVLNPLCDVQCICPVVCLFSEKPHPHTIELTEEANKTEKKCIFLEVTCVRFACLFLVLLSAVIYTSSVSISTIPLSLDSIVQSPGTIPDCECARIRALSDLLDSILTE